MGASPGTVRTRCRKSRRSGGRGADQREPRTSSPGSEGAREPGVWEYRAGCGGGVCTFVAWKASCLRCERADAWVADADARRRFWR
eukprot:3821435-Rhodomonas_salina.4